MDEIVNDNFAEDKEVWKTPELIVLDFRNTKGGENNTWEEETNGTGHPIS